MASVTVTARTSVASRTFMASTASMALALMFFIMKFYVYLQNQKKKHFWNFSLGRPRMPDLRSSGPPKPRSLNNFVVLSWPRKMLPSTFFDTPNSPCEVTASEAAEAGLIVTMTWPTLSRGHMQSFNLLALKLWICIDNTQLLRFEVYIVRCQQRCCDDS